MDFATASPPEISYTICRELETKGQPMTAPRIGWSGVFPAATTQFKSDLSVDYEATQRMQDALVKDGVDGLVILGTVGEGNSLDAEEKRKLIADDDGYAPACGLDSCGDQLALFFRVERVAFADRP